ncbi:MAG TPA: amino acid adenylation domain-containing protein, partial [Blastocatellia bacterium]|nr:amino acid adenylation domain-containing protein [Blastocatellia bacterium]
MAREYEVPVGESETALAKIWADMLKVERVGRYDNFFELGGHSLLAMQVISQLRHVLGVEVATKDLFAHPVLTDFARVVGRTPQAALPAITLAERGEPLPLCFAQQRLWFLAQMEGVSEAYHIFCGWRLKGELDRRALDQALDRIVARHEALRTICELIDGKPMQRIIPAEESRFHLVECELKEAQGREEELNRLVTEEASAGFDLEQGPLIRGQLIGLGENDHALLLTLHHIVSDGWSMDIFIKELNTLYEAFARGQEDPLPPLTVQYADYVVWQREWLQGEVLRRQAEYWQQALAGAPALLELPTDHVRPAVQEYVGGSVELELEEGLTRKLKELSQRAGTTLYMTLLAGWSVLLARLSGQGDIVVGTPVANRGRVEIEGLIGFFVNTLALRLKVSGSPTVTEMLQRVKEQTLAAQQHQDIPFEQIVELVRPARSLAHNPLFQVMFDWWQWAQEGRLALTGLEVEKLQSARMVAKFDLRLCLQESGGRIVGRLEYATALFERETAERYVKHWRTLLDEMVADDMQAVDRLPLLGEAERHQVLVEWNATEVYFPKESSVHELFEAQAEKCPDAIAVVDGDQNLTYSGLNVKANRLAHHLRGLGVGPDARVAIILDRSMALVVAELAVLKCGAAYVPIDPTFPGERQVFMALDCAAQVAITTRDAALPEAWDASRVNLDDFARIEGAVENLSLPSHGEMAAYVMYTSGSTGQPKGVMVPHRAITRLVFNCGYADFKSDDRVAFAANPAFDAVTMEVWAPLLNGGRMVVIDPDCLLDPSMFAEALIAQEVSVLWMTVGLFNQYVHGLDEALGRLRYLIVGGDVLDPRTIAELLSHAPPRHLVNGYGPTETTTFAITHEITEISEATRSIPLGNPISNTQCYILDENHQPSPIGVGGEIYIGGMGVAHGYLNRAELTAERFRPDPFGREPGARLYKTGDLGRWLAGGEVEFLGRNDLQIKIRGFRVELGEIEARLTRHPAVCEAVVLTYDADDAGKRLAAYFTGQEIGAEALRSYLSGQLPEYMLPTAYVWLERLPLTPNGKVDRQALPAPQGDAYVAREYEVPVGESETALAKIWA